MAMDRDHLSDPRIQDYIDGRLSGRDQAVVAAYLLAHPEEASQVDTLRRQNEALRGIGQEILDEPVPERLRKALYPPKVVSLESRRPRSLGFLEAAAAILLFCVGGGLGWFTNSTLHPTAGSDDLALSDAASAYAFYRGQPDFPIEFPPDRNAELVSWITRSFQQEIAPPDLEPLGYHYLGGRLLPSGTNGAGTFMFESDSGERVLVFFWPSGAPPKSVINVGRRDGTESRFWFGDGFGFAVIGEEANARLQNVADSVFAFYEHGGATD